ncbi:MAG: hypothetical protein HY884_08815 [Deltaproteobacteria bacterium]|nr:hypothetical protein [Deltaproteobacteria bacterium]
MNSFGFFVSIALVTAAALVLNLPFGYLRIKTKKYSVKWFAYIHLPIPFIYVLRTVAGLDYRVIPVIAAGAIAGQFLGGKLNSTTVSSNER